MPVLTDTHLVGHELGPFIGADSLGWHADCECSVRFEGSSKRAIVDAYERHYSTLCLAPGLGKARASLAEALKRGKPMPGVSAR